MAAGTRRRGGREIRKDITQSFHLEIPSNKVTFCLVRIGLAVHLPPAERLPPPVLGPGQGLQNPRTLQKRLRRPQPLRHLCPRLGPPLDISLRHNILLRAGCPLYPTLSSVLDGARRTSRFTRKDSSFPFLCAGLTWTVTSWSSSSCLVEDSSAHLSTCA